MKSFFIILDVNVSFNDDFVDFFPKFWTTFCQSFLSNHESQKLEILSRSLFRYALKSDLIFNKFDINLLLIDDFSEFEYSHQIGVSLVNIGKPG